jgi:hypothetical protein
MTTCGEASGGGVEPPPSGHSRRGTLRPSAPAHHNPYAGASLSALQPNPSAIRRGEFPGYRFTHYESMPRGPSET